MQYARNPSRLASAVSMITLLLIISCTSTASKQEKPRNRSEPAKTSHRRDWDRFPAIIERNTNSEVIALGDVHGGYDRLAHLLSAAGLIKSDPSAKTGYAWSGGNRLLVCTGDLIDKGDRSIEVIDLMMGLQDQAPASGGEVIVTMGNHEAEFLANPENKKATEFRAELQGKGIDPDSLLKG